MSERRNGDRGSPEQGTVEKENKRRKWQPQIAWENTKINKKKILLQSTVDKELMLWFHES